ncbi:hypothetical protein [Niabella sp.]|uniref:hypothetical protein n=1 Tax=Niabella sp. TaxID=1962976 RepID=UPI0026185D85|nr:hypothetical protein [Niabella sp.]
MIKTFVIKIAITNFLITTFFMQHRSTRKPEYKPPAGHGAKNMWEPGFKDGSLTINNEPASKLSLLGVPTAHPMIFGDNPATNKLFRWNKTGEIVLGPFP